MNKQIKKKIQFSKKKVLIAALALILITIVVGLIFLKVKTNSVVLLSYGNIQVDVEGYVPTALGELIFGDYGYLGRVFYFIEEGVNPNNLAQDTKAFSILVFPNQDELWSILSSIMEESEDAPYSMTEMDQWYINVWDNWKGGISPVWVAQRGNILVSAGYPIKWDAYLNILKSIKGDALDLDPVKDSFVGLESMGMEVQYYDGYGEGGSEILDDSEDYKSEFQFEGDDEVPPFFEMGGSAIGIASAQVAFSILDGDNQEEVMKEFLLFLEDELDPTVIAQEDNIILVRAFFDIYETGSLVGYYRLVFTSHDAVISILWEVLARSYNGYEETDAAVLNYVRQWKAQTNLITPLRK